MLLVVSGVEGFCEISEEELLVLAQGKVRLEDCFEGLAVLVRRYDFGKGVYCDKWIHICGLHCGLEEVLDAEILGEFLFGQSSEGMLGWDIGELGREGKRLLIL